MRAAFDRPISVYGGEQWRPLLHVRDVSHAVRFGIKNDITGLYNLSGANYTIKDLAECIVQISKCQSTINYVEMPFEDMRNYHVICDKYRLLGWHPHYLLSDGVEPLLSVMKEGRVKNLDDPNFSNVAFLKDINFGSTAAN